MKLLSIENKRTELSQRQKFLYSQIMGGHFPPSYFRQEVQNIWRRGINLLILISLLPGCAVLSPHYPPEVTVDQVIQMSKTGTPPQEIITKIDESHTVYYLKSEDVIKLKQEGVKEEVIDHMLTTEKNAIEASERTKWRSYYYPYRYDTWYYPYYYRSRRCH